ncbi:MAG: NADH-quinone oxidoreductase subunit C [Thermodesulfobacteriota bacterium]
MSGKKLSSVSLLVDTVTTKFGDLILETTVSRDEVTHVVDRERLLDICTYLKNDSQFQFNFLSDLLAVDCHRAVPRFEVVYQLYSIPKKHRLRLKVRVDEGESVPSVTSLWRSADWAEREAYDMIGVTFDGHPNLTRIYLPSDWDGFPLRKDYPLRGYKDQYNPFGEEKKQ